MAGDRRFFCRASQSRSFQYFLSESSFSFSSFLASRRTSMKGCAPRASKSKALAHRGPEDDSNTSQARHTTRHPTILTPADHIPHIYCSDGRGRGRAAQRRETFKSLVRAVTALTRMGSIRLSSSIIRVIQRFFFRRRSPYTIAQFRPSMSRPHTIQEAQAECTQIYVLASPDIACHG